MAELPHTEASLKALTIPKLKEILLPLSLSVLGRKDELITRILDHYSPSAPSPAKAGESTTLAAEESTGDAEVVAPATEGAEAVEPVSEALVTVEVEKKIELTEEEKEAKLKEEEEKRAQRATRFGIQEAVKEVSKEDEAKKKRGEKFGLDNGAAEPAKIVKSVAAIDLPLGHSKPERKPKAAPAATSKPTPVAAATVQKDDTVVDPGLAKRIADDEEKKKKRAARFASGPEPAEKKTKVDA